jgi:hypothetical protein
MLPEDTLLGIFDFYRLLQMKQSYGSQWNWLRLAHVCRTWRYVISMSPRSLDMQILCTYGAPIRSTLNSWPSLPLVISINSNWKLKHIPQNVIVAFRHPDRLYKIELYVTSSIIGSIVEAIQKPCQALESIQITVRDATGPSIPFRNAFLGGSAPHLREIKLDGISFPFPEIRQVLLSANNLVELYLSRIPNDFYFSPEDLVTGLSTLVQLSKLTVGFHSPTTSRPPPPSITRSPPRTTFPSLTFLDFHGESEYLEEFVARIELPALFKITIGFFNDIVFEMPEFCKFIARLNPLGSPTHAFLKLSRESVKVYFFRKTDSINDWFCSLQTSCRRLDWRLSFVTQITSQLSPLLPSVRSFVIDYAFEMPIEEDVDSTQWLELFQLFTHVTNVTVWENRLVPVIVQTLAMEGIAGGVLPDLTSLCLNGYRSTPSVAKAAEQFVATRRLSGHTVDLTERYSSDSS